MTDKLSHTAKIIEAVIFASSEPVSANTLKKHLPEGVEIDDVLALVAGRYGEDSGIELRKVGTAWAFRTRSDIASLLMVEKVAERTLSRAALETLAIIAYHQPVTRAEIEEIRGVSISSGSIDMLLEQDWIKPGRPRRAPGRPGTWMTTEVFLDHFGLDDIQALPGLEELKQAGLLRSGTSLNDRDGLSGILETDFGDGQGEGPDGDDGAMGGFIPGPEDAEDTDHGSDGERGEEGA